MKKLIVVSLLTLMMLAGCEQQVLELQPQPAPSGEPGSANFTKFVAIGNSITAGFQAAALFNEGQANSFPAIMAKQFAIVSSNDPFHQPDINSVNGYNAILSNPQVGIILGRLILFDPDGTGPKTPTPAPAALPGIPAPYNTADLPGPFAGDKAQLNNFGVPGIILAQALTPLTGGPSSGNPAYNPLYARFASQPGVSTILGDAIATSPTFFSFWLGMNDVLGYAITGGSGAIPLTDPATFDAQYKNAIGLILGSNPELKGVVANIQDVTTLPFFRAVAYNAIPLDAATANQLNSAFGGYNTILDALKGAPFGYPAAEVDARKIAFAAGNNQIVINDETLNDYGDEFDALQSAGAITAEQRALLVPYEQVREASSSDIITLTAGAILGVAVEGNPQAINGLTVPLQDQYVLIPTETMAIHEATQAFNATILSVVSANNDRLALVDISAAHSELLGAGTLSVDGIPIEASFIPPFGIFSEDGIHPNSRGSAYTARIFIEAINEKFEATVPTPNISTYRGTTLPVSP